MGEVYEARDTRLDRDVAIKMLDFGLAKALESPAGSSIGVWVYESQRDNKARLTVGDHTATDPVWTPDGQHILFQGPEGMF